MNIINSSVFMKSEPKETSPLETECLFGETVEIFEECLDWVYCKLNTDNYHGWVKKGGLGKTKKPTHRVIANRSFVYAEKNPKSNCLLYLPLGAQLVIDNIQSGWAEICLCNYKEQVGYVPSMHIVSLDHRVKDWVAIAELSLGIPYKWGGRDTIGIDCSALLQLSYQTYGEDIPRNTSQQVKLKKKHIKDIDYLKRGCVIFWKGHVGIMIDKFNCIHANAFHMQTKIEPLNQIINRIGKDFDITKMMDFN
ncbi:NlpC/P60 family protein [Alphaproteobacteria bacterium]|nr:NlpC/P60 family protein [Alphaproteobacteria bacterium]